MKRQVVPNPRHGRLCPEEMQKIRSRLLILMAILDVERRPLSRAFKVKPMPIRSTCENCGATDRLSKASRRCLSCGYESVEDYSLKRRYKAALAVDDLIGTAVDMSYREAMGR